MCCSTGACGPEVETKLVQFAADLGWLKSQGVFVQLRNRWFHHLAAVLSCIAIAVSVWSMGGFSTAPGTAAVNAPHSRRFAKFEDVQQSRQRLECGDFSPAFGRATVSDCSRMPRRGKAAEGRAQSKTLRANEGGIRLQERLGVREFHGTPDRKINSTKCGNEVPNAPVFLSLTFCV